MYYPRSRKVWFDALCINQDDPVEKEQQVQMIDEIFSRATKVLVWLGEHGDNSEAVFASWAKPGEPVPPEIQPRRDLYVRVCGNRLTGDHETNRHLAENLLKSLSLCWIDLFAFDASGSAGGEVYALSQTLETIRKDLHQTPIQVVRAGDNQDGVDKTNSQENAEGSSEAYRRNVLAAILNVAEAPPGPLRLTDRVLGGLEIARQGAPPALPSWRSGGNGCCWR